jgi:transcriptional regulator with XRE-family HTH domain
MEKNHRLVLIGQQIRRLREERGLTQESFAAKASLDRAYYGGVERGERNISALNLIRIAVTMGVEVGELFPSIRKLRVNCSANGEGGDFDDKGR